MSFPPCSTSYDAHPQIVRPVLEAIDGVSKTFLSLLGRQGEEVEGTSVHSEMEHLVAINQALLQALGVSHPALEQVS